MHSAIKHKEVEKRHGKKRTKARKENRKEKKRTRARKKKRNSAFCA